MKHLKQGWYLQTWQYGQPYAAEQNLDDAIALALKYGASGVSPKVLDGTVWMDAYNPGHGAPASIVDVERDAQKCHDAGLLYLPWTNPLWGDDAHLMRQAGMYAAVGDIAGYLVWDSEPYPQFWGAWKPVNAARRMLDEFHRRAPDCINIWQPDPRPGRLAELRPEEWTPYMHIYTPQSYWTDFGTAVEGEIDRAADQAAQMGFSEVAPTIPANGDAGAVPVALGRMAERGMSSCFAWRMGTLSAAHLGWLRDLAPAGELPPDPATELAELRQEIGHLSDELGGVIVDFRDRLTDLHDRLDALRVEP